MGYFGSGGNSGAQDDARSESDALIDQTFKQNQVDIENKKRDIYAQRLDIIKGQGGQSWTPTKTGISERASTTNTSPSKGNNSASSRVFIGRR